MRRAQIYLALLIAFLYLLASYFGYRSYQANPQGLLLLLAPGPIGHDPSPNNYVPAFPFVFGFALTAAMVILGVVALIALFLRTLSTSDVFRFRAVSVAKFSFRVILFCLPGVFLIDWLWDVLHS